MPGGSKDRRIPVTVVTGYLGAGKTTLVNHLLSHAKGRRMAVIVNEFGEIGIDGDLIRTGDEELIELSSGCICCVVRGDLIRTLRRLLTDTSGLEAIVIETTGLANPSPVIQTFFADQLLAARLRLDAVVAVADALNIERQIQSSQDAADQLALASIILLNKISEAADPDGLEAVISGINPFAPIRRIDRGQADPSLVFDSHGFDLERITDHLTDTAGHDRHDHFHGHTDDIGSVSLRFDGPFDAGAVERWLTGLLSVQGENILRTKGIVWAEGSDRKLVLQAVHMLLEGDFIGRWRKQPPHVSRLVFIGRHLDRVSLERGFLACRAQPTA
ncbi:CobW family GTP-binding protein [Roseibium marinum]|uniref:G3E family GTPase n=1 Tax=Roseibium marinum TaxID=281252 RepID=A0A2S3V3I1_9HYPH|nr:GTP-binding protein [Roseibium marinum]POF34511.1 G3E family GTPase [Roseibium marinum]